jgi:hypothetical protein
MIKPLFPEDRSKLPGTMDMVLKRICRFPLQNGECLPIGKPGQAPNDRCRESMIFDSSGPIDLYKNALGKVVLIRPQAANSIRQSLRQHRQYAIWKINTISSAQRFTIKG